MRRLPEFELSGAATRAPLAATPLSAGRKGFSGVIGEVRVPAGAGGLDAGEIERRLLEMGFVEGAPVEIVHEGLIGRDPIAVKISDRIVALRRREARAVLVHQ